MNVSAAVQEGGQQVAHGHRPRYDEPASTGRAPLAKARKEREPEGELTKAGCADALYALQVELVKLQKHLIKGGERIVVLLEGRDAAGKDGTIKHVIEHFSPREARVVSLAPIMREVKLGADAPMAH